MYARIFFQLSAVMAALHCYSQNRTGYESMLHILLRGDVDTVGVKTLSEMTEGGDVILLDAREEAEYAVSHLRNAQWIGYEAADFSVVRNFSRDREIVVYCSVGKRSEDIARKLKAEGFSRVYNLYGGIFSWANRGYPLVNAAEERVFKLHPYNAAWGFWITKSEKTYEP